MKPDEILLYIFGGTRQPFPTQFGEWMAASPPLRLFAETYRDKIRKKVRTSNDEETRRDLYAELEVAQMLLRERRFTLEYEKYGTGKMRGPDFTVTYRTHTPFNLEVTRLRGGPTSTESGEATTTSGKIANTICAKVGQMPPSIANVLVILAGPNSYSEQKVSDALKRLRESAERKDDDYFVRRGFMGARDFLRQLAHLSLMVYLHDGQLSSWPNPLARHPLPADISKALLATLQGQQSGGE